MFICPKCNIEVVNPVFMPPPPWWRRGRGTSSRPYPVCPTGHRLRNRVFGNLKELSLPLAFLRGLSVCVMFLAFGMLEDLHLSRDARRPGGLIMTTAVGLIFGTIAFVYAWIWAGRSGPVHRLTSRAFGLALGYLAPTIVTSHALYFHWSRALQIACGHGLLGAVKLIFHGSIVVSN